MNDLAWKAKWSWDGLGSLDFQSDHSCFKVFRLDYLKGLTNRPKAKIEQKYWVIFWLGILRDVRMKCMVRVGCWSYRVQQVKERKQKRRSQIFGRALRCGSSNIATRGIWIFKLIIKIKYFFNLLWLLFSLIVACHTFSWQKYVLSSLILFSNYPLMQNCLLVLVLWICLYC